MGSIATSIGKHTGVQLGSSLNLKAPINLAFATPSDTQIILTWSKVNNSQDGFAVERSTDNINYTEIATVGNVETYTNSSLTKGSLYYYRVRGFKGTRNSDYCTSIQARSAVYVSLTGTDATGSGAFATPYATINYALGRLSVKVGKVIVKIGDYVDMTTDYTKTGNIKIVGENRETVRMLFGTRITAGTLESGYTKVYKTTGVSIPTYQYELWQHDIIDELSIITEGERREIHRGLTYRLTSTRLRRVGSIQSVEDSLIPCFYMDGTTTIYFQKTLGSNLAVNPIIVPVWNYIITGSYVAVENMTFMYRPMIINGCTGYMKNVTVKYNNYSSFSTGTTSIITYDNCEGAGSHEDGFGYTGSSNCHEINCWAHSNLDEGSSAHETATIYREDGLYEKNICGTTDVGQANTHMVRTICINNENNDGYIFTYYKTGEIDIGISILEDCIGGNYLANVTGAGTANTTRCFLYRCQSSGTITDNATLEIVEPYV